MKIIADDKIPFLKGVLEPFADVIYVNGGKISRELLKDADALLIRTRTHCNEDLLKDTQVKFIGTATIGFDHIDTDWCDKQGITWKNAPGCNSGSVNQYIASTIMSLGERFGFSPARRALGVIGVGNVGRKVVRTAEMFGMAVYLCDPPRVRNESSCGFISLEGILRECDIITLHVPLNMHGVDRTYHLVDEYFLSKVNPGTIIINTSRGEVVQGDALKKALKTGRIAGFALDVWENEPNIDMELLSMSTQGTPHIAGYSADGKAAGTTMIVRELSKFFDLDLDDWSAEDVPEPEQSLISIDCENLSNDDIIRRAVMHTYNVNDDDRRMRKDPSAFEQLRGEYPLRREFGAYTLVLKNGGKEIRRICDKLGFKIEEPIQ